MKKITAPEILHADKTIQVSKQFLVEAGCFNTPEFTQLRELRAAFPDYAIKERTIKKNPNKQTYGSLTYEAMREYINGKEEPQKAEMLLAQMDYVMKVSTSTRAPYAYVKKWFLGIYKDDFQSKKAKDEQQHTSILTSNIAYIKDFCEDVIL